MLDIKHAAYLLKKEGYTVDEICKLLRRSQKTIYMWQKKYNWNAKCLREDLFKQTAEEDVQELISHNLKILKMIAEKKNSVLKKRGGNSVDDLQSSLISRGDIDALQKLFSTIKGKELTWSTMVKILREFMEHLEAENLELAKKVLPYSNEFLNVKRKEA